MDATHAQSQNNKIEKQDRFVLRDKGNTFSKKHDRKLKMDLKGTRLGKKIMEINYISKKYGDKALLENFEYTFKRNEKIGIIGKNGCGKTTLLNIIAGLIPPDSGNIDTGETVVIGYYKQDGITSQGGPASY